ncbi:alpha/beta hydrolase [Aldersonia kunmingensis]|uniref:alpha/beta hydrolase n=1 Tax=Aldersonia kunmingensis TaxID=408066 RepID=UPI0008316CF6|nr:alpha/beta hydrolase [Aldersonia kunmingensis]
MSSDSAQQNRRSTVRAYAEWIARARPADYLIELSAAPSSLPVIGRSLAPLGGVAALGVWGARYLPDNLATRRKSEKGSNRADRKRSQQAQAPELALAALQGIVAPDELAQPWPAPSESAPWVEARGQRKYVYRQAVQYGDDPSQKLDVWRRERLPGKPAPVLLYVPGGAWVVGSRILQGHALMSHLAEQGWVCLGMQYRTSPQHRWPRHIQDVKAAVAWARANARKYGGDPNFVAIAGCSAGGHLASLAGLTPDDPQWDTELPADADTSVDAVVSLYGRYDWADNSTVERKRFVKFLERVVVKRTRARHPQLYREASPVVRTRADAPPFLVVHGSRDGLIPVGEARAFVEQLRSHSKSEVGYLELPGAGHGFDLLDGPRTAAVNIAVGLFLNSIVRSRRVAAAGEVV